MKNDYTYIKGWSSAEELAFLVYPKEFQNCEVRLIYDMRKVRCLTSEVHCLNWRGQWVVWCVIYEGDRRLLFRFFRH